MTNVTALKVFWNGQTWCLNVEINGPAAGTRHPWGPQVLYLQGRLQGEGKAREKEVPPGGWAAPLQYRRLGPEPRGSREVQIYTPYPRLPTRYQTPTGRENKIPLAGLQDLHTTPAALRVSCFFPDTRVFLARGFLAGTLRVRVVHLTTLINTGDECNTLGVPNLSFSVLVVVDVMMGFVKFLVGSAGWFGFGVLPRLHMC